MGAWAKEGRSRNANPAAIQVSRVGKVSKSQAYVMVALARDLTEVEAGNLKRLSDLVKTGTPSVCAAHRAGAESRLRFYVNGNGSGRSRRRGRRREGEGVPRSRRARGSGLAELMVVTIHASRSSE